MLYQQSLFQKKWEILCNAPSTENPWKLLITTNTLELRYPEIKDIESTQRQAARFVKNKYGTTPGTITKI